MQYRVSVSSAPQVLSSVPKETGRRTVLPAHCADNSHIGILSILYNNIGKDLSRVSMPVALNEPLNFLQRVSEELEYSQLLDIANRTDDPYQRMVRSCRVHQDGFCRPFHIIQSRSVLFLICDSGFCKGSHDWLFNIVSVQGG